MDLMSSSETVSRSDLVMQAQKAMQAGQFADAAKHAGALLDANSEDQDGLYMAAVAARYLNDFVLAQSYLQKLKQVAPDYGRAYQEEGHLLKAQGERAKAITAFQAATRCNPALASSWQAQVELLNAANRPSDAAQAQAQLDRVRRLIWVGQRRCRGRARLMKTRHFGSGESCIGY